MFGVRDGCIILDFKVNFFRASRLLVSYLPLFCTSRLFSGSESHNEGSFEFGWQTTHVDAPDVLEKVPDGHGKQLAGEVAPLVSEYFAFET